MIVIVLRIILLYIVFVGGMEKGEWCVNIQCVFGIFALYGDTDVKC
jgi:hypothetical protein